MNENGIRNGAYVNGINEIQAFAMIDFDSLMSCVPEITACAAHPIKPMTHS